MPSRQPRPRVLTLLGEGEGNISRRRYASHGLTLRSHRPCACGDVFYAHSILKQAGAPHYCLQDNWVDKLSGSQMTKPMMIMMWKSDRLIVVKKPVLDYGQLTLGKNECLSGARNSFYFWVEEDNTQFTVTTKGGSGDANFYFNASQWADADNADAKRSSG
jgi:hypothetical protein